MTNKPDFNEITKNIVSNFLHSVLFIDDSAYRQDEEDDFFDSKKISSVFAKYGILTTIYSPLVDSDLSYCNCKILFYKSDVIVLDWNLKLDSTSDDLDEEVDSDNIEPRGFYTKRLIKSYVNENKDTDNKTLKLFLVYTVEMDLFGVTNSIYDEFKNDAFFSIDGCKISSSNIVIYVCAKDNGSERYKYNPNLKENLLAYELLPEFIISRFAEFVGGLVPNFALSAITSIRDRIFNILDVFSKDLDCSFLEHYVTVSDDGDPFLFLSKIFGDALTDLIKSNNINLRDWIEAWIAQNYKENKSINIEGKTLILSSDLLKKAFLNRSDFLSVISESKENNNENISKAKIKKNIHKLFGANDETSNYSFARLVQHSNVFMPKKNHQLTTGTVVLSLKEEKYWLCIQQSCDSERISKGENRSFLFLPLSERERIHKNDDIAVVVGKNEHLYVEYFKSYLIKLFSFGNNNEEPSSIYSIYDDNLGKEVFTDSNNNKYLWIAEIKALQTQQIVNSYAAKLSRVGLENFEWLRNL